MASADQRGPTQTAIVILSEAKDLHAGACRSLFGVARAVRALLLRVARGAGASTQCERLQIKRGSARLARRSFVAALLRMTRGVRPRSSVLVRASSATRVHGRS